MRNWAAVNGLAVRQQSNQQQTTIVTAGTLPMSMYEIEDIENLNQVNVVFSPGFTHLLTAFFLLKTYWTEATEKNVFNIFVKLNKQRVNWKTKIL